MGTSSDGKGQAVYAPSALGQVKYALGPIDALLVPATTEPAPPWRESIDTDYVWQLPWRLTGAPAVVVPVGSVGNLPVAVQVVAPRWNDHIVLAVAQCIDTRVKASN
jgi:Asp-tRNA(Asn)/Glu-tRNA(Gln) amidotransferase A subunit family amidase